VTALAGCAGGGGRPTVQAPPPPSPTWLRADLKPVSQPVAAGGLFVVYIALPGSLAVVGLDAGTGRTVWQLAASRAQTTPGVAPSLDVVEASVLLFSPAGQLDRLVAVDPSSGVQRWATRPGLFGDWPGACADEPKAVCTSGLVPPRRTVDALRFAGDSGSPRPAPVVSKDSGGRALADDLFDTGERNPEMLTATSGAAVTWRRPLATVFPGPRLSSDNGWNLDRIPDHGLFVGSVSGPLVSSSPAGSVSDLASTMTAGFRISDGAPVWSDAGSKYVCSELPCPGQSLAPAAYHPPTQGLRTRATGTATVKVATPPTLAQGADVRLEGFDLTTGRTVWSFDAGPDGDLLYGGSLPQVGVESVVVKKPAGGVTELDLRSGAQRTPPTGRTGWCQQGTSYEGPPVKTGSGKTLTTFVGELMRFACDVSGARAPVPGRVPAFVGPVLRSTVAWSEVDKVIAAPAAV
jgi:outer membrane protein assembly factor BamB